MDSKDHQFIIKAIIIIKMHFIDFLIKDFIVIVIFINLSRLIIIITLGVAYKNFFIVIIKVKIVAAEFFVIISFITVVITVVAK